MEDGKVVVENRAQRKRAFHGKLDSVEVGRQMACVHQCRRSVGFDAQGEAGGVAFAVEAIVEGRKDDSRIAGESGGGAHGSDEKRGEHTGLHAFAGDVANQNEGAAIGRIGDDLEEVASYFAGGAVVAFNGQAGDLRQVFGNEELLDLASAFDFGGVALLLAAGAGEADHKNAQEAEHRQELDHIGNGYLERLIDERNVVVDHWVWKLQDVPTDIIGRVHEVLRSLEEERNQQQTGIHPTGVRLRFLARCNNEYDKNPGD